MGTENELTENEVDAIVQYFEEIAIKMRGLDKADRFSVITSILDQCVRRIVTDEFTQVDLIKVHAHLTVTLHNSLPPEVLEADGFASSISSIIGKVLNALGKAGIAVIEKGSDPEDTFVSKNLTISVLDNILVLLGATPHLRVEYGIANHLTFQKFAKLYPQGCEEKETQIFMGKEVETNMKMLLSDREEFWRICESLSDDSKKSISELVKASEKDEKLMEVAEKAGWTKVRVVI